MRTRYIKYPLFPEEWLLAYDDSSEEDRYLLQKATLIELVKCLADNVAEEIVYGEVSSGAADDLSRATEMARKWSESGE